MHAFNLTDNELSVSEVHHNLPPSVLYEHAIRYEKESSIAENGALVAYSGEKTGRSPKDKRIVKNSASENDVWWGSVNVPIDSNTYEIVRERARDYLNICERLYCFDGFAGADPKYRIKIRVICSRPYHALFMHNMLIRPTSEELANFGKADFVIYNAGAFPANRMTAGVESKTCISLSLEDRELVILGTEYAGEMKKGVFTVANYFAPKRNVLSMHCSATADKQTGRSSLLFGLSGTGKTTLSADPKRDLIGDDEHCWSDDGIFNIEGGCYAKAERPNRHKGLVFTHGLPWVVLAAVVAPNSHIAAAYLLAYAFLRYLVAWVVGVWGIGDEILRHKMWLIPLRDAIHFAVWLFSFTSNRVTWGSAQFILKGGEMIELRASADSPKV